MQDEECGNTDKRNRTPFFSNLLSVFIFKLALSVGRDGNHRSIRKISNEGFTRVGVRSYTALSGLCVPGSGRGGSVGRASRRPQYAPPRVESRESTDATARPWLTQSCPSPISPSYFIVFAFSNLLSGLVRGRQPPDHALESVTDKQTDTIGQTRHLASTGCVSSLHRASNT